MGKWSTLEGLQYIGEFYNDLYHGKVLIKN